MADTSPLTIITNQIISLLVGDGTTYFARVIPAGNRFSKLSGVRWPVTPPPNARNLPRFVIDCPDISTPVRNQMRTFTNVNGPVGDVVVQQLFGFQFTTVYLGIDRSIMNQMEYFMTGVLVNDPSLGLTAPKIATSGALRGRITEENSETTGGQNGLVQRITFPVTVEYHRVDLVAAKSYTG